MNSKRKGDVAEAKVLARLSQLGRTVLVPWTEDTRYDLLVDNMDGTFTRGQVKTGRWVDGSIHFNTKSVDWYTKKTKDYVGQIDVFWVYSEHTERVYEVKVTEAARSSMSLRVDPQKPNANSTNWAVNYEV